MSHNHDLTVGKPRAVLWRFCLPLFGSVVFQQLYNIADSIVAGRFINENAFAAVGNGYEITLIFIAIAFGCNTGCSVTISRLFGAKRLRDIKTAIYTTFVTIAFICALLMGLGFPLLKPLLHLINTPSDIFNDSESYMLIYMAGIPFVFFYNVSTGIFSALGDSKTPFWFLAFSSVSNIILDIVFVLTTDLGVKGVAWATFICQGISCLLAVWFVLLRVNALKCDEKPEAFSFKLLKSIAAVAVPGMLQQSFVSIGNIIIQGIINPFGPGVIAGYSAAIKLNNLVITSFSAVSNGISNYTAQNLGAGKHNRIHGGFKAGILLVWIIALPFALCYFFFGRQLTGWFLESPTELALDTGKMFLCIAAPFYLLISCKLAADGVLRGGLAMGHFMASTLTDLVLRVVLALVFSKIWRETGIWVAWPIGWGVSTVMSIIFYYRGVWKKQNSE